MSLRRLLTPFFKATHPDLLTHVSPKWWVGSNAAGWLPFKSAGAAQAAVYTCGAIQPLCVCVCVCTGAFGRDRHPLLLSCYPILFSPRMHPPPRFLLTPAAAKPPHPLQPP